MTDDGMLSQDEIDALLNVSSDEDEVDTENEATEQVEENISDYLTSIEVDTLGEIGNISFGSSATTLSTLLNQKVEITTPEVAVIKKSALHVALSFPQVRIQVSYSDGFTGENHFVIKAEDAAIISDIMLGGDGTNPDEELNEIHLSAVKEAMNQMMGAAATSMSTIFDKLVNISPPSIELLESIEENEDYTEEINSDDEVFVRVAFQLKVGNLIDSKIMQMIPFPFANELVAELLGTTKKTGEEEIAAAVAQINSQKEENSPVINKETTELEKDVNQSPQYIGSPVNKNQANVQQAQFSEFESPDLNQNEQRNLDMLLDIPLNVTVELGRTKQPIRDILDLRSGSIIELEKLAGEPVDVLVNEKLIAKGEVVVIDENFGVRVTDIISQSERIMKLK